MKTLIAYAMLGIPVFVGQLLGGILTMPISLIVAATRPGTKTPQEVAEASANDEHAWRYGPISDMAMGDVIAHGSLDILTGVAASFLAGLLFYLLGVHLSVMALLILITWEIAPIPQWLGLRMLVLRVMGLLAAWFVVRALF